MFNPIYRSVLHYLCRKFYGYSEPSDADKKNVAPRRRSGSSSQKYKFDKERESEVYLEVLELLLEKGVNIDGQNFRGETALMQAAAKGNESGVRFLLDHKANWKLTNV